MITNLLASVVVSFYTNVHEHHWTPTLKTKVCEVSERTTWKFAPHLGIPEHVKDGGAVSQTTMLLALQSGQWVELSSGRTSGIFVTNAVGWIFYVPHPHTCPQLASFPTPCPPCPLHLTNSTVMPIPLR